MIERDNREISTASYWIRWVNAARESAKKHWQVSKEAYNEYLAADPNIVSASEAQRPKRTRYPIFWSSTETVMPSYYARTPETVAKRMFDSDDNVARVSALILERLSKYLLSVYPIDCAMTHAVMDFLMTSKCTTRVYLEEEYEEVTETLQIMQNPDTGEYVDQYGQVVMLEGDPVIDPATGMITVEETKEQLVKLCTDILPVVYDDIVHTPNARNWKDVKTIGFRLWMDRREFADKFGEEMLQKVSLSPDTKSDNDATRNDDNGGVEAAAKVTQGVEVWEIWDKPTKKVKYVCLAYKDEFLLEQDDPYQLADFFPCAPFVIGTKPPKSMYPTPMYAQLKPTIDQLHMLYNRIRKLIRGLRRRAIVDASLADIVSAINDIDGEDVLASKNFQQLVERGGIQNAMYFLPLQELSNALVEAQGLIAQFDQVFYQFSGVPDVVRGATEKGVGVETQQLKGEHFDIRTSWKQHQIQELARYSIEMQCDLALAKMPDTMLSEVCGLDMIAADDQQYIPQAIQLLRNDTSRKIRIDIETDSLTYQQNQAKQERTNLLVTTVMQGLTQVAQIGQTNPAFISPAIQMLMASVRGVDIGKAYESDIRGAAQTLEEMAKNPPQTPPPPPDYEGLKIQLQGQKQQMEQMNKQRELDQKEIQLQTDIQAQSMQDMIAQGTAMLEQRTQSFAEYVEGIKLQIEQQYLQLDQIRVQNEQYETALVEREKMIEENRLAMQANNSMIKAQMEAEAANNNAMAEAMRGNQVPEPQTVIINNPAQPTAPQKVKLSDIDFNE